MSSPKFSILTPAIPERAHQLAALCAEIDRQRAPFGQQVEHIVLMDSRGARTVGEKRDELVRLARGEYLAFVDDDDRISPDYIASIMAALASESPDVVTFYQHAVWNGLQSTVIFRLGQNNGPFIPDGVTDRNAWHVCVWRAAIARLHHFPASNYGEDWAWARHLCADAQTEAHIPRILHTYIHDEKHTAAPPPVAG